MKKEIRLVMNEDDYNKILEALGKKQQQESKIIKVGTFVRESALSYISMNGNSTIQVNTSDSQQDSNQHIIQNSQHEQQTTINEVPAKGNMFGDLDF